MVHIVADDPEISRFSGDPFTEEERKRIRKMMEQDSHVAWFWATMRKWAGWTFVAVAALVTFRENVKALIQWLKAIFQ